MLGRLTAGFCLFVLVIYAYAGSRVVVSTDSMWSVYLARSLINDQDLILDEYRELARERKNYGLRKRKGHLYSYFPVGTALMATPFVWIYSLNPEWFVDHLPGFPRPVNPQDLSAESMNLPLQRFIASIFSALTVLIIFTIAAGSLPLTAAAAVGLIAAFCTPLWSTASRGLWQHGPSALLISATLLLLMKIRTRPLLAGYSGALLAFAYIVRPTNAVAFICFALYILLNSRQAFRVFILSTLLVFVPFLAFSYDFFGRILPPYYNANRLQFGWHFFEASLANLFSPNRGLFFLSPILIPAMISMWVTLKKFHFWSLPFAVLAAFCGHLTAISLFPEWWGGHAFGARYMTETIPYVIYFFVIWLAHRKADFARFSVLALAAALSFYIHFQGATNFRTFMWNVHPVNIDRAPERVWDFGDMQFLR